MIIEIDSHTHTVASGHAYSTLQENIQAASANKMRVIALTEHGPSMPGGPHPWFFSNLKVIPRVIDNVGILRGIEANILNLQGEIDLPAELKGQLDIVLGSLHEPVFAPSTKKEHTKAVVNTIKSGSIDIFAHGGNPSFPLDYKEVAAAAAEYNVLIEINNSSFTTSRKGSEGNCSTLAQAVIECGGALTFGSDAHIACRVGVFDQCIEFARVNNLSAESIISTDAERFLSFLKVRHPSVEDFFSLL